MQYLKLEAYITLSIPRLDIILWRVRSDQFAERIQCKYLNVQKQRTWKTGSCSAPSGTELPALRPHLFSFRRYLGALREGRDILHAGGITTVSDGAFGTLDLDTEWLALRLSSWNRWNTPFRTVLLADGRSLGAVHGYDGAAELIEGLGSRDTGRVKFRTDAVKLFADGAFYSQLMQLGPPGYLDGHEGEWLMTPDELLEAARPYWRAGFQIHVHANGDAGIDATLDVLDRLQAETPRTDHRFALHHFGYSRPDQIARIARSGVHVSANPFYVWALADLYAQVGLGPERAAVLVRAGSLARAGVPLSFHSDFTMAPAQPLRLLPPGAEMRGDLNDDVRARQINGVVTNFG